jgi:ribosomal protein L37AE/L43A
MRHEYRRKPRKCPACGSARVARILYGLPAFSKRLEADMNAARVVLGGCCVTDDDPSWQCADCEVVIFKKDTVK